MNKQKQNRKKRDKNTPYDDVFRTLMKKCTSFVIPVINEVFKTSYSMEEPVILLANEHFTSVKSGNKKRITDSKIGIQDYHYHLECESKSKKFIVMRMIEYDFEDVIEQPIEEDGEYFLDFPFSAVIFLREALSIPDFMAVNISFPDGQKIRYKLPAIKVQKYTKEELFEKNLLFFIPYYIMRYEKSILDIDKDEEKLKKLIADYRDIYERLSSLEENKVINSNDLYNLVELTDMLIDVVAEKADNVKREVMHMGGRVLELKSEKILQQGLNQGLKQGIEQGIEQGIKQGIEQGIEQGIQQGIEKGIEQGIRQGIIKGRKIGSEESEKRSFKLISFLIKEEKYDEIEKAAKNKKYRKKLYKKYQIEEEELSADELLS